MNKSFTAIATKEFYAKEIIFRRQMELVSQGKQLSEVAPQYSGMVTHKLKAVSRALENVNLMNEVSITTSDKKNEKLLLRKLRKWILTIDKKLTFTEERIASSTTSLNELERIGCEQEALQRIADL
ncbi:unnamed protein product [Enterobius vermicularis]|uniref:PLU-1 domain-containing protein n=1 Tax=Enterobius vermicularis TaxID=51028 RepID=A0A0N4UXL1_ENTVE|nr:unnamed protein product [Enterobius vermicularis]